MPLFERAEVVDPGIAEANFEAFFKLAAVGVTQVDAISRRFLRVNQCFAELAGYPVEELEQLTLLDVTHPDDAAETVAIFDRLTRGEISTFSLEKRLRRKDGSPLWVILTAAIVRDPDCQPLRCVAVVQDVTERKQREVYAALLADVQDAFSSATDGVEIMQRVGASIGRALGVSQVNFVAVDEIGETTSLYAYESESPLPSEDERPSNDFLSEAILADLHAGKPVAIADVHTDPRTASNTAKRPRISCVSVLHLPDAYAGRCRFLLTLLRQRPHVWPEYEIELLRDIAGRVSLLLERNRAETALRDSEGRLRRAMNIDTR